MIIERTKNASRNIIFGLLQRVFQLVFPFVIRTVMIYCMGIEYVGLNSLFVSVLHVLNLAELGVGSAMVFSMYKPVAEDDEYTMCALLKLYKTYYRMIGLVICIIGILFTPFIPYLIKSDLPDELNVYVLYGMSLATTVISYWLFAYKNSLFQAHQRVDIVSRITVVVNSAFYVLQIIIIVFTKDYYLYVISNLLMQATVNIVTAAYATKIFPTYKAYGSLEKSEIKKINQRIKDLFTAKIGGTITSSADTVVISAFLGLTSLAIFQNYSFILSAIFAVIAIVFNSVIAGLGNSFVTETIEKNYIVFKRFSFIMCWIICICCSCLIALLQPFVELWVGKELLLPIEMVILFCIYFYVYEIAMIWATVKDAAGIWHEDRFRPLIGATANLIMNIVLVQKIGLFGVLLSTIISYVCISMPWLVRNLFKILFKRSASEYVKMLLTNLVITFFSCMIVFVLCESVLMKGFIGLLIRLGVSLFVSNFIQLFFLRKKPEFEYCVSLVKRFLKVS